MWKVRIPKDKQTGSYCAAYINFFSRAIKESPGAFLMKGESWTEESYLAFGLRKMPEGRLKKIIEESFVGAEYKEFSAGRR